MADLTAGLFPGQLVLLRTMATPFLKTGRWPVWDHVQHELDRQDLDAEKMIRKLPRVGSEGSAGWSYGLTHGLGAGAGPIHPEHRPGLTIAAALHLPDLRDGMADPFLLQLRKMIELRTSGRTSDPDQVVRALMTPADMHELLPDLDTDHIDHFADLFTREPVGWSTQRGTTTDGSWTLDAARNLLDYRKVFDASGAPSLERYVAITTKVVEQHSGARTAGHGPGATAHRSTPSAPLPASVALHPRVFTAEEAPRPEVRVTDEMAKNRAAPKASPESAAYIDLGLVKDLEAAGPSAGWSLDKLLDLCRELNSNVAARHRYASAALVRIIMDHVPPIFGVDGYEAITNLPKVRKTDTSRPYISDTDRAHLKRLSEYARTPGDDAIHRQARKTASRIGMGDLAPRTFVNGLLQCVLEELHRQAAVRGAGRS